MTADVAVVGAKTSAIAHLLIDRTNKYRRYLGPGASVARITPASPPSQTQRTALWFQREARIARFVTLDGPLAQAARELGLPV